MTNAAMKDLVKRYDKLTTSNTKVTESDVFQFNLDFMAVVRLIMISRGKDSSWMGKPMLRLPKLQHAVYHLDVFRSDWRPAFWFLGFGDLTGLLALGAFGSGVGS